MQALDRDAVIRADPVLAAIDAVSGANDNARIVDRGDRAISWLHGAGEPAVKVAPAATGLQIFFHIVRGRIPERLDSSDGLRIIKPLAELLSIFAHPIREPGVPHVDRFGLDGVLKVFNRGLIHDEVEEADTVVEIAAFFAFFWDPVKQLVDFGKVLRDSGDGLHLDDTAVMSAFDGGVESGLPSWGIFDLVFEGLDD